MNPDELKEIIDQIKDAYGENGLNFKLHPGYLQIKMDKTIDGQYNEVIEPFVADCLGLKQEHDIELTNNMNKCIEMVETETIIGIDIPIK